MKKLFLFLQLWLRARKMNKALLAEAEKSRSSAMYAPPTRSEVLDFVNEGKVNGVSFGRITFYPSVSPIPKTKKYEKF